MRSGTDEFEDIVRNYQENIYSLVFSFVRNEPDTDEIVQKTFVNAFKNFGKFRKEASLKTWLMKIAVNNVKNYFRKKKFFSLFFISNDGKEIEPKDIKQNLEEKVQSSMTEIILNEAIEKLPARQKEVFVMKHLQGMTISEISKVLRITEGSVKANIFKAMMNLRKNLVKIL